MYSIDPDHAALIAAQDEGCALCTLVQVDGAFSRAPGAQLAVRADGSVAGDMTGGCLEAALVSEVARARAERRNRQVRYGKGSPYIDIRLPCGGGVDVLIDVTPDRAEIANVLASLGARREGSLIVTLGDGAPFIRCYYPTLRLLIFGNGPEVKALAALGGAWGVSIECVRLSQHGAPSPDARADAWSAIIALFHEHEWEDALLAWALASDAFFVGALGGITAVARRQSALRTLGFDAQAIARVRGPVGLLPFAKDAQMLAISILAEVAQGYGLITRRLPAPQ